MKLLRDLFSQMFPRKTRAEVRAEGRPLSFTNPAEERARRKRAEAQRYKEMWKEAMAFGGIRLFRAVFGFHHASQRLAHYARVGTALHYRHRGHWRGRSRHHRRPIRELHASRLKRMTTF